MESKAERAEGAKEGHRKSASSSRESSLSEPSPPPVGVIGSSTRNVVLPSSEHRQSMLGSLGSSTRGLTVPSYEPNSLLTVASGSSQRDVGMPSSQRHQSISGSKGSSVRGLVVPSLERQPSPMLAMGSSTRGLVAPVTPPMGASMDELAVPSLERPLSITGSAPRASDKGSATPRKSIISDVGSRTAVRRTEHRKSIISSKGFPAKESEEAKVPRHQWQLTRPLVMVTVLTCLGSSFQYGYYLWIANHPPPLTENFFNHTSELKKRISVDKELLAMLYNLIIAVFSFGGIIGCILFSSMVDKFGRRGSLLLNNIFSILCAFLMGVSPTVHSFEYSIFVRLVTGICTGLFSCLMPIYLAELAPKSVRGSIMMVSSIFIILGLLTSQILGLPKVLGTKKDWPLLLSIPGGLALFQVIILPFFPESPRYLLIQKRKEEKARKALRKLRCQEDVQDEINELYEEDQTEKAEKVMSAMKLVCSRGLRWQIISIIVLMSGQELSGISAAYYFSERIYTTMLIKRYATRYISIFSTILVLVAAMVVTYVIDTVGRRVLILIGLGFCSILCVLVTMTLELQVCIASHPTPLSRDPLPIRKVKPWLQAAEGWWRCMAGERMEHYLVDVLCQFLFDLPLPHRTHHWARYNTHCDNIGNLPPVLPVHCLCTQWACTLAAQIYCWDGFQSDRGKDRVL
ncbi:solute carrier family 2, facilitated glucose transporter member 5-like isoform X2 [Sceloporus undulatus]|uniref:solute carrier family 2, facilitated glucose transporter member 5-like isoform X2 n=1 Tax=Sceloporus undulatus TaxID=8520 RepID=UPI001C4C85D3|nr:solute carrier family 2, facilitated glucose transporter member 5-like isoform X2 [Sceloporus undulatus]